MWPPVSKRVANLDDAIRRAEGSQQAKGRDPIMLDFRLSTIVARRGSPNLADGAVQAANCQRQLSLARRLRHY